MVSYCSPASKNINGKSLVRLMGEPEWAREEIFKDRLTRGRNSDALSLLMQDWFRQWDVDELFHACQERRIPAAPVNRMANIFADTHLRERNFFVPLPVHDEKHRFEVPSVPFQSSDMGWRLERPAPRLGDDLNTSCCAASHGKVGQA